MKITQAEQRVRERWESPDPLILQRIRDRMWTSHNIPLSLDESTLGANQPLIGDDRRTTLVKETVSTLLGGPDALPGKSLLDLGCLEGGLSFEMAREDMVVLGVEGRLSNYEKCALIKDYYGLANLDFSHLDVKDLSVGEHGTFQAILCCGLLYHLDDPVAFLGLLNELTEDHGVLFLDTHIAPSDADLSASAHAQHLSELRSYEHEGTRYRGRWYTEYDEGAPGSDDQWTAVSNYRSFWLTHRSLIRALYRSGFTRIFQLFGGFEIDTEFELQTRYSRVYLAAVQERFFSR
jgi:2-polyprenyl-3-methyl-5-hydroxy-6-metoxy-1,4-benzoquinol methylase